MPSHAIEKVNRLVELTDYHSVTGEARKCSLTQVNYMSELIATETDSPSRDVMLTLQTSLDISGKHDQLKHAWLSSQFRFTHTVKLSQDWIENCEIDISRTSLHLKVSSGQRSTRNKVWTCQSCKHLTLMPNQLSGFKSRLPSTSRFNLLCLSW